MFSCIKQLANDMMNNIYLNALVTGDIYAKDIDLLVNKRKTDREEAIKACGGLKQALEWGAVSESEFMPLNVCGNVSNALCPIFLDNNPPLYRYQFDNRVKEKGYITKTVPLSGALNGRDRKKNYLLRVDCDGHSYLVYILATEDEGYLFQGNAAESMKCFTLQEWMNAPKAAKKISLREHRDIIIQLENTKIVKIGPLKEKLVDTFSIDDDRKKQYKPFNATNFSFCFREVNEEMAKENLRAIYKRARIQPMQNF